MDGDKPTVIDAQADVEGNLRGKDAQILGKFRGEIELSGRLLLGDGARVNAKVKADAAEIAGEFKGELKVRSLVLMERGRVEGAVEAQAIAVREGAQLNGSINAGALSGGTSTKTGGAPLLTGGVIAG
jgi:cytoskeletal protein CcmA (bactofilin family)